MRASTPERARVVEAAREVIEAEDADERREARGLLVLLAGSRKAASRAALALARRCERDGDSGGERAARRLAARLAPAPRHG